MKNLFFALFVSFSSMTMANKQDIVDIAVEAGQFNTLVTAVKAAGLVETLKSPGPFTVLAPTDQAFAALPEGVLQFLLDNPEELKNVLLYHVISGKAPSQTVLTLSEATMANGQKVTIELRDGSLFINDSKVVMTDIMASNGIIHVIDAVLVP